MPHAQTKQPLHDDPDWFWPGGNPAEPLNHPTEMHEATYVGEVAGGERDHLGQEMPNGTGEMKFANGVLSIGTFIDGWIQEGTWTDTLADTKAAAEGELIWKSYTGTYQNGEPYNGSMTFTDGSTSSVSDGNIAAIVALSQIHDEDTDQIRDGI